MELLDKNVEVKVKEIFIGFPLDVKRCFAWNEEMRKQLSVLDINFKDYCIVLPRKGSRILANTLGTVFVPSKVYSVN